jgi:hypothetical protein
VSWYLRKIDNPAYWLTSGRGLDWLGANEIQANAYKNISTQDNRLSLYRVNDRSEVPRIAAAIAATAHPDKFGYALIDVERIEQTFAVEQSPGTTSDAFVDLRHVDLVKLSCRALLQLAELIRDSEIQSIAKREILTHVKASIESGHLPAASVAPPWLASANASNPTRAVTSLEHPPNFWDRAAKMFRKVFPFGHH